MGLLNSQRSKRNAHGPVWVPFARLQDISRVVGIRWAEFELLLIAVAVFIHVLLRVVGASSSIPVALTFTLVTGNWTAVFIAVAQRAFLKPSFPWNWFVYLPVLFAVGASGSFLAYVISFALWFPAHADFIGGVNSNLRLGTLMTMMFGIVTFLVAEQRSKLEKRNVELQRQVLIGEQEIRARAAELDHAREIQIHLLPRETPQLPGLSIACAWQPATTVSGDYFDVFQLKDGRMAFCIADVTGKGVGAALVMANVQASLRAFAHEDVGPAQVCAALNKALCNNIAPGKFVTLLYGVLDPKEGRFVFTNAGHCLPVVIRRDGSVDMPATHSGVLGLFSEWTFEDQIIVLGSKDCLLLVTDGLLEASNKDDEEFGYERLISLLLKHRATGAHSVRQTLFDEVSHFCNGTFQDDASMILIMVE